MGVLHKKHMGCHIYIYICCVGKHTKRGCLLAIYMCVLHACNGHNNREVCEKRESNKEGFFVHKRSLCVATTLRVFVYRSQVSCVQECV